MIREKKAGCNHCIFPLSVVSVYESEAFKEMAETHMWCRVIIKDTRGISGAKGFEAACRRSGESTKRSKCTVKYRSNVLVVGNVQPRTRGETFSILARSKLQVRSRVSEVFESRSQQAIYKTLVTVQFEKRGRRFAEQPSPPGNESPPAKLIFLNYRSIQTQALKKKTVLKLARK